MSWSLQLQHGDFTLSGAKLGTVTNEAKLTQDLRCALLEHMGTDPLHPDFGSLIDGGVQPDGTVDPGVIGRVDIDAVVVQVQADIQRIIRDYQNRQLARAKSDRMTYNKSSLVPREVLIAVTNIAVTQVQDTLNVTISLQTASDGTVTIDIPITDS